MLWVAKFHEIGDLVKLSIKITTVSQKLFMVWFELENDERLDVEKVFISI